MTSTETSSEYSSTKEGGNDDIFILDRPGLWDDVEPIEQDDGPNAPVSIAYSPEFTRVMNYLRAVIHRDEVSVRALELTAAAIDQNPANYTAWHYRRHVLFRLRDQDLQDELEYLNDIIEESQKNYQVWYHRQALFKQMKQRGECSRENLHMELKYMNNVLMTDDQKNYHAWAHRQWFLYEFGLFESDVEHDQEMQFIDTMLQRDFRNNSAWNHRFYVLKHRGLQAQKPFSSELRASEVERAFEFINRAPNNESAWNYVMGMARHENRADAADNKVANAAIYEKLRDKAEALLQRAPINVHARWVLLECYTLHNAELHNAGRALELCTGLEQYDAIRKKYWQFRGEQIRATAPVVAST